MLARITKSVVDRLHPGSMVWDTALIGYGVRKQRRSAFYLIRYRINGRQRFLTLGRHGAFTPDTARREAQRLLGLVASRIDPALERPSPTETFGAELARYLERKSGVLRPRSMVEITRHLQVQCKSIHHLPLGKIDRRTVALALDQVEQASGPIARNRVRSSLSAFFSFAVMEGLVDVNPTSGTRKATEINGRDRVLSHAELAAILSALSSDPFSEIIRLLVLSGQRRSEIGSLKWCEVDLERNIIALPPERCKNHRQHEVPLSTQARAVIDRQPRRNEFVWACEFTSWARAKANLDSRLDGMAPWTLHDIRRSAITHMGELGVLPHILETIANHVSGHRAGVAGIYNRARYQDDMRTALQRWGDYVDSLRQVSLHT